MSAPDAPTVVVLIVEDDDAVAELLRQVLTEVPGWTALVAHDAVAARAIVQQVQISVLVLDVNLPGISGLELLELLRQDDAWTDPPVIIVSAVADQPDVQATLRQTGVIKTLQKPFDIDQVIATIRESLA